MTNPFAVSRALFDVRRCSALGSGNPAHYQRFWSWPGSGPVPDDILARQDATAYRQVASFISISLSSLLRLLPQPFFIAAVLDERVIQHHACIYWCHCLSSLYGASRPSARVFSGLCLPCATASPSPAIVMMLVHEPMPIQSGRVFNVAGHH
ncbi:hypothetical protein B0H11DRAFT_1936631 [Mycena galericulata]|nr:hypothetical protein B0H11DRAFT_1936631 [Mycena galericulata]